MLKGWEAIQRPTISSRDSITRIIKSKVLKVETKYVLKVKTAKSNEKRYNKK